MTPLSFTINLVSFRDFIFHKPTTSWKLFWKHCILNELYLLVLKYSLKCFFYEFETLNYFWYIYYVLQVNYLLFCKKNDFFPITPKNSAKFVVYFSHTSILVGTYWILWNKKFSIPDFINGWSHFRLVHSSPNISMSLNDQLKWSTPVESAEIFI